MKKIKFKWIIPTIGLLTTSLIMPVLLTSCSNNDVNTYNSLNQPNNSFNNDNTYKNKLTFVNYFESLHKPTKNTKKELKQQITKIMNDYRLYEWNDYYQKSKNKLIKSNVLNFSWSEFNDSIKVDKNNDLFNNSDINIQWTQIYRNQDEQFRYFNDFINIINNENNKNHEDFLFLRWEYYCACAAIKYHSIKVLNKPIYEIKINDWLLSLLKSIVLGDTKDLFDLIKAFLTYYGVNLDIKSNKLSFIESSVIHLMLVSKDLIMRFSSKNNQELNQEINKYPLWKLKANRAKQMYLVANDKYQLLANSFIGDINEGDLDFDFPDGVDKNEKFNQLKDVFGPFKDALTSFLDNTLSQLARIDCSDYCYKNELINDKEQK